MATVNYNSKPRESRRNTGNVGKGPRNTVRPQNPSAKLAPPTREMVPFSTTVPATALVSATGNTNLDPNQWLHDLQSFLNETLKPIIKDDRERARYLEPEPMWIWMKAFTHETVSPSDNYEDLEFLGDAMLKSVFPKYLMKRFPKLHKGPYTELNVYYMSKIEQAQLSESMGLDKYVRIQGIDKSILNINTDVFESFFGALDTVSDLISEGIGFANCYNMILHLFSTIVIDESKGKGSAKTQVIQIFSRFGLPDLEKIVDESMQYQTTFMVKLLPVHIDFLRSHNVHIDPAAPIIGVGRAATKKEAEFVAYNQALDLLAAYGINTEWADQAKQELDFADPAIRPYLQAVVNKFQTSGYSKAYFFIPRKTATQAGAIVQLVGVRPDGQNEVLSTVFTKDRDNSYHNGKIAVIQQYVGK